MNAIVVLIFSATLLKGITAEKHEIIDSHYNLITIELDGPAVYLNDELVYTAPADTTPYMKNGVIYIDDDKPVYDLNTMNEIDPNSKFTPSPMPVIRAYIYQTKPKQERTTYRPKPTQHHTNTIDQDVSADVKEDNSENAQTSSSLDTSESVRRTGKRRLQKAIVVDGKTFTVNIEDGIVKVNDEVVYTSQPGTRYRISKNKIFVQGLDQPVYDLTAKA